MNSARGHRLICTAAAAMLLLGLATTASNAAGNETQSNNGQHKGWYKKDKDKTPVSVPEPGTTVLLLTGLVAAMSLGRKGAKR